MADAREADEVLIAAFVNASAVARQLYDKQHVAIVCAGTDGRIGNDDVLLAGLLVERLQRAGAMAYRQNAQAMTARETWLHAFALPQALGAEPLGIEQLAKQLRRSEGGQTLVGLGLDNDILAAAQLDRFDIVPRLDPKTFRIRS
jgi:2-phosphosulfolactate phosphatase